MAALADNRSLHSAIAADAARERAVSHDGTPCEGSMSRSVGRTS